MKKFIFFLFLITSLLKTFAQKTPLWLRYPAISPDGKTVVFSFKGDLYKVSSSGGTAWEIMAEKNKSRSPK